MSDSQSIVATFHPNVKDITGQKFGKLKVLRRSEKKVKCRTVQWVCKCDCGEEHVTSGASLRSGTTDCCRLCANLKVAAAKTKHGMSKTTEDNSWRAMIARCYDPKNWKYPTYGAVGIVVCDGLRRSENFHAFMGAKPHPKHTIDRWPTLRGSYTCGACSECLEKGWPLNVRWATAFQQAQHQSKTTNFEYDGETHCLMEWSRRLGINYSCLFQRIKAGWSTERAFTTSIAGKRQM